MKGPIQVLTTVLLATAVAGAAEPVAREFTAANGTVVKYRFSAPATLEPGKTYPLVLFLHGAGERGDDNKAQLKHGVQSIIAGADTLGDPVFLVAPQCPKEIWWSQPAESRESLAAAGKKNSLLDAVLELTADTMKSQPIDSHRLYVTGISMGGFGTWDLLGRIPEKIAAAIPICGGGDAAQADRFKEVSIWAFHGGSDSVVPVAATRNMVTALEKAGGKPKVTIYPDVDHDSWTQTYDDPQVIRWMIEQRRK